MADLRPSLLTLLVGMFGALVALGINLPLALLAGPAIAVSAAGLCGFRTEIAPRLRDGGFLLVGVSIGSLVGPESFEALSKWPLAFGLLAILTIITPWAGRWLIPRLLPFGQDESFLASAPGHLSLVVGLADSLSLSLSRPVVLASIRLLALTLLVPMAAKLAGLEIGAGLPMGSETTAWGGIGLQVCLALILAPVLSVLKLPAPTLISGLLIGSCFHLTGLITGTVPDWLAKAILILMGSLIGTRFSGMNWRNLFDSLLAGAIIVVLASGLAVSFAVPAAYLSGLPLLDVLLGFSPGGLETMIILGAALGADPSFVAAAHLFRLFVLAIVLTLYASKVSRRNVKTDGQIPAPRAD